MDYIVISYNKNFRILPLLIKKLMLQSVNDIKLNKFHQTLLEILPLFLILL